MRDRGQLDDAAGRRVRALAYVANWRFVVGDRLRRLFTGPSPLQHLWSLAIEEQFYLMFPLVHGGALLLGRRWKRDLLRGSWAAGWWPRSSWRSRRRRVGAVDRLYFRTDIRAAELLVGALFGLVVGRRGFAMPAVAHRAIRGSGVVLLTLMLALVASSDTSTRFWYQAG